MCSPQTSVSGLPIREMVSRLPGRSASRYTDCFGEECHVLRCSSGPYIARRFSNEHARDPCWRIRARECCGATSTGHSSEQEWLHAARHGGTFDFLNAAEEDRYTLRDGKPFDERGKVVLVPFPFDDLATEKARPAVCLTEPVTSHRHIVLAFVTSRQPEEPLDTDVLLDPVAHRRLDPTLQTTHFW